MCSSVIVGIRNPTQQEHQNTRTPENIPMAPKHINTQTR